MLVLGLQGSPRKKGNTNYLMSAFMEVAQKNGAQTLTIDVTQKNVIPCKEYTVCEKKGFCPINDDVRAVIYPLLRQADVVVISTPIFFYNMSAQLKAVVDRCQTFWARKYMLKLKDPAGDMRRGFMLSAAATKGKNLFEGLHLTTQYFFDAIDAKYEGSLTYRGIEGPGDMAAHPTVLEEVDEAVSNLLAPFLARKKVLFAGCNNTCRSQIASAFTQMLAGDKLEVFHGGIDPGDSLNPDMVQVMQEKGIDMEFRKLQSISEAVSYARPDVIVTIGCNNQSGHFPDAQVLDWELDDPSEKTLDVMRQVCDAIEKRVADLVNNIT